MSIHRGTRRRVVALAALAALALATLGGTAVAAQLLTAPVATYTGCLATSGGTLSLLKEGDLPQRSCPPGSIEARVSGGDITSIAVGPGLTGGGDNGDVTIQLDSKYSLPQACSSGQVAKWNGSGWACAADNDTQYANGDGLALSGNTFSIEPAYRVKNDPDCGSGQFATGFGADGAIQCAAPPPPPTTGAEVWHTYIWKSDAPYGFYNVVDSLDLPAASFLVTATGFGSDDSGGDDEVGIWCDLVWPGGARMVQMENGDGVNEAVPFTINTVVTLGSAGTVKLQCRSFQGSDHVREVELTATKVGTIHEA